MMPRLALSLSLVALGAGAAACGRGHDAPSENPSTPTAVTVQVMAAQGEPSRLAVTGEVVAENRFEIASKVAGRILSVPVEEGTAVRRGDVLLRIDAPELEAAVAQSRAAEEAAKLDSDMAQRQADRFRRLAEAKVVTPRDLEMMLVAEAGARARHEGAKAALRMSEENLAYAVLRAPSDGRVVRRLARVGDLAVPGRPLLEMEDDRPAEVRVTVPSGSGLMPAVGMRAEIALGDTPSALGDTLGALAAQVERVVPDASGHVMEAYLSAEGLHAPSGSFVRAALLGEEEDVLRVPEAALLKRGALTGVFLAQEGHAVLRWLRLDADGRVVAGLAPGDSVILAPSASLEDGDPVAAR